MILIPIIALGLVFLLTALRKVGNINLAIWQIMLLGAIIVMITGQITPMAAATAINLEVMAFLFCMFIVGQAIEQSGLIDHAIRIFLGKERDFQSLVIMSMLFVGIGSALFMNDTLAIVGTPAMLLIARISSTSPKPLLLTLAFAITIGSVMSPIGNPQNLLIAMNMSNPFIIFLGSLAIPTIINLAIAFLLIRHFYSNEMKTKIKLAESTDNIDIELNGITKLSVAILATLICLKMLSFAIGIEIPLVAIAIGAATPIILMSKRRIEIIRKIDWHTLIFFAAMFILMQSVWNSGVIQELLNKQEIKMNSTTAIISMSILLSQFISNVPLVALMLLMLPGTPKLWMALAAGSTIAGNLTILGAASNVIIIQNAEKKGETITFWEFARIGIPLTIINSLVYLLFLGA